MTLTFWPSGWRPRDPLVACGALFAMVLTLVVLGHDGGRIVQMASLAAPLFAWLLWPVRSARVHRLRTAAVWLWAMAFAVDGAARAYLLDAYQASPDGAMVLGAAANTNARESFEYLSMHWRSVALWFSVLALAGVLAGRYAHRGLRRMERGLHQRPQAPRARWPRWSVAVLCAVLLTSAIAYANKPSRRLHPLLFWSTWSNSVQAQRAGWAHLNGLREETMRRAQAAAPAVTQAGPATVMLVIGESINRDNMALYGYGRATSPRLMAQQAQLGDQMVVLRNAWSVDASTLPAIGHMMNFGQAPMERPMHVLALARAAGYKVWWISNQDDVAIEQQHARMADVTEMVNRTPGRASVSLDGEIFHSVHEALDDTAPRKLIVVHLMGAHPHYALRYPAGENPFDDSLDAVEAGMVKSGRSTWVRETRQEYDAAVLYQDFIVSELLQMTRTTGPANGYRGWMYLSDHGQEVGHSGDHAGHSPSTPSGYRIPAIVWRNRQNAPSPGNVATEPFRADWAAWTLADLLHLQWAGDLPERDVLDERYAWKAPKLPFAQRSFKD